MRDHRYLPDETSDITDQVHEHDGAGLVRMPIHRKRNKTNAKASKASRKRNR